MNGWPLLTYNIYRQYPMYLKLNEVSYRPSRSLTALSASSGYLKTKKANPGGFLKKKKNMCIKLKFCMKKEKKSRMYIEGQCSKEQLLL